MRVWQQLASAPTSRQVPPEDSPPDERHSRGIAAIHSDGNFIGTPPARSPAPNPARSHAQVGVRPHGWLAPPASGSSDGTIRLWNLRTGRHLRTLQGHTDLVRTVTFDARLDLLVSGSYDGSIRVWRLSTGTASPVRWGTRSGARQPLTAPRWRRARRDSRRGAPVPADSAGAARLGRVGGPAVRVPRPTRRLRHRGRLRGWHPHCVGFCRMPRRAHPALSRLQTIHCVRWHVVCCCSMCKQSVQ